MIRTAATIRCISLADGSPGPAGQWLSAFDADTGFSDWTGDRSKALQFADTVEAYRFWMQVKSNDPVRIDGKPNRPLTAFTVEIEGD